MDEYTINLETIIYVLEKGTCTDRAVKYFLEINNLLEVKVVYKNTFKECIKGVKNNKNSLVFIPHIHLLCNELRCNKEWLEVKKYSFVLKNPPLYLVKGRNMNKSCVTLPTLIDLLEDKSFQFLNAANTQDAARKVWKGEAGYGITNETGQKTYGLEIIKELQEIHMTWVPFKYIGK